MASITEIRAALAQIIDDAIPDIMTYAEISEVFQVPAAVVMVDHCDYEGAFQRGMHVWTLSIYVLVREQDSDELDELINGFGPRSIPEAVYLNPTLGLADVDANMSKMVGYGGKFQTAQVGHTGCILKVTVRTLGTS
jgi:hypothetical protein